MTTPPAPSPATPDGYARYRRSLGTGAHASRTLAHWLPLATLWTTGDAAPAPGDDGGRSAGGGRSGRSGAGRLT
ncbi:hypothetical protein [Streptomyces termitum]|uniref:hypothetical protein n=1 Tax=Streptomyces termitum TaxID=67368 RepID=UPI0033AF562F